MSGQKCERCGAGRSQGLVQWDGKLRKWLCWDTVRCARRAAAG